MLHISSPEPRGDRKVTLNGLGWDEYLAISDNLGEHRSTRLSYRNGRLTLLEKSRRHEWARCRLRDLLIAVALGCGIEWEDAGSTTYRRTDLQTAIEADDAFYLGQSARQMRGPIEVDLSIQPPPDLAIEIKVGHSVDESMAIYAGMGVPEVWRLDVPKGAITFARLLSGGLYGIENRSSFLPHLEASDILDQIRLAEDLGSSTWYKGLGPWVRDVILPRIDPTELPTT